MRKNIWITIFEWIGSALGIGYALLIASNTGYEVLAFVMLLTSAVLFACWAVLDRRWAFLGLQFFYASAAIVGFFRWG
ncbi:hypothetical protein IV417_00720 [Alphaproteobacteria bacterium KMM 3653]|uniref:Uncharacterized protein n=1 Tax=Harenicola maris TaxID=2841044 RepID=A0AAP2CQN2_9RHOB|nr:hypothetical protein [Harenicola maris]